MTNNNNNENPRRVNIRLVLDKNNEIIAIYSILPSDYVKELILQAALDIENKKLELQQAAAPDPHTPADDFVNEVKKIINVKGYNSNKIDFEHE